MKENVTLFLDNADTWCKILGEKGQRIIMELGEWLLYWEMVTPNIEWEKHSMPFAGDALGTKLAKQEYQLLLKDPDARNITLARIQKFAECGGMDNE
jgi:hypothetical protein